MLKKHAFLLIKLYISIFYYSAVTEFETLFSEGGGIIQRVKIVLYEIKKCDHFL